MRLRFKLMLPFCVALGVFILVIHFYMAPKMLSQEYQNIVKRENAILKAMEPGLVRSLLSGDLGAVYAILDYNKDINENWVLLKLYNDKGKKLYPLVEPDDFKGRFVITINHNIIWEGDEIGVLKINSNWESERNAEIYRIYMIEILAFLIFVLIIGGGLYWQSRWIHNPILQLQKASKQLSAGNFKTELPAQGNDELGDLTRSFNIMVENLTISQDKLHKRTIELEKYQDHLEDLVASRTEKLKESERTLSTLMSNLPGMAYRRKNDANWTMEYVSDGAFDITGYKPDDLEYNKTKSYRDIIHTDDIERINDEIQKCLTVRIPYQVTYRIINLKGHEVWVWEQGCGIYSKNDDAETMEGFVTDISDKKKMEEALRVSSEQLIHSEKLAAIGKLSASVAHEFNNPITGIRNVLESVSEDYIGKYLDEHVEKMVNMAVRECNRVASLTKSLQDFNRPSAGIVKKINIHDVINEMIVMVKKKMQERKISLYKHFADNIPEINIVPDQIKQVLLNIIQNAEESLPRNRKGQIDITTELEKENVLIRIKDNGDGIPYEIKREIFEPFFTTKSAVKGTGLGLAVSYGIIKKHGGDIKVESKHGCGATFTIKLSGKV